ncbi:MAG TPA: hypothetical protein VFV07_09100 [Rhizomicrobium sp.]|nr:hypothetical protein [Rhizomicrobium sp.]
MKRILTALAAAGILIATGARADTLVAGAIAANGTKQVPSGPYTVNRPTAGHYIITFTQAYSLAPTCVFAPIGNVYITGLTETSKTCDVTFVSATGVPTNVLFNFIAAPTTH